MFSNTSVQLSQTFHLNILKNFRSILSKVSADVLKHFSQIFSKPSVPCYQTLQLHVLKHLKFMFSSPQRHVSIEVNLSRKRFAHYLSPEEGDCRSLHIVDKQSGTTLRHTFCNSPLDCHSIFPPSASKEKCQSAQNIAIFRALTSAVLDMQSSGI